MKNRKRTSRQLPGVSKCPTGIRGLDEITLGGLPRKRTTLVCGGAGCGKTLLAIEFIVRGITEFGEPGVFVAFEETLEDLAQNVGSLGFDIDGLIRQKKMAFDHVRIEPSEIEETGEFDLEGLFVRIGSMIDEIGAKRVAIDTLEALFGGFPNETILRAELRRLFKWLQNKGVTSVITGERGETALTRNGLEEYVSDCVILLDYRITKQVSTRRLRIVKYRGSSHGTNEYPSIIDDKGLSILPISSLGLNYPVSNERVSTGIPEVNEMLDGKGYFRGSSVLVSGAAGSGKTSLAASFAQSTCEKGRKCLFFSFEESPEQILRNMSSAGLNLKKLVNKGLLKFSSVRPTIYGLEMHLLHLHNLVDEFKPHAVVVDPITSLICLGEKESAWAMITRMIDFLKNRKITSIFVSLTRGGNNEEQSEVGVSSLMDTWLLLRTLESAHERNRLLYVMKSRGMAHSNQMREYLLTGQGIQLRDVYVGPGEVLTGSARLLQEARDRAQRAIEPEEFERRQRETEQERIAVEMQVAALQTRLESLKRDFATGEANKKLQQAQLSREARELASSRKVKAGGL